MCLTRTPVITKNKNSDKLPNTAAVVTLFLSSTAYSAVYASLCLSYISSSSYFLFSSRLQPIVIRELYMALYRYPGCVTDTNVVVGGDCSRKYYQTSLDSGTLIYILLEGSFYSATY